MPDHDQIERAASFLNAGKKIAILAGQGALGARPELLAVAERLGAPIIKPLLGKGAVPDDSPYTTGGIGLLGTKPSQEALEECDTLADRRQRRSLISSFIPSPVRRGRSRSIVDPKRIGLRYPVEVGLVGDAATRASGAIAAAREERDRQVLPRERAEGDANWNELMTERGTRTDKPMKPQVVAHELNKLLATTRSSPPIPAPLPPGAARHLVMRGDMMFSCSGNLATMACGLPYAIAAAIAYPDRQVVAFVGDGGLTMLMGELATCVKYGLNVKIIVIKNNTLGQIKWEQMVFLGNPEYALRIAADRFCHGGTRVRHFRLQR